MTDFPTMHRIDEILQAAYQDVAAVCVCFMDIELKTDLW